MHKKFLKFFDFNKLIKMTADGEILKWLITICSSYGLETNGVTELLLYRIKNYSLTSIVLTPGVFQKS